MCFQNFIEFYEPIVKLIRIFIFSLLFSIEFVLNIKTKQNKKLKVLFVFTFSNRRFQKNERMITKIRYVIHSTRGFDHSTDVGGGIC